MRIHLAVLALFSATALATGATAQTTAQRDLTVTGPREKLERFVAEQNARSPQRATSAVTPLDNGRARAIVTLPADQSGQAFVQTLSEARAAGLSYEYADAGPVRIRRR